MSYDISFRDPVSGYKLCADIPHQMAGGTYMVGGTTTLELNVTYNYSRCYAPYNFHLTDLDGKKAVDMIPVMEEVISNLGDDVDDKDYWNPTEGNAKRALIQLVTMAKMRPDAIIYVM